MSRFKNRILLNLLFSLFFSSGFTLIVYILGYYLDLFSLLSQTQKFMSLALLFVLGLFVSFSSLLNYSFSYIDQLISIIKQISEGNFDIAIPILQNNEFGHIASHINQMAYDLKQAKEKEDKSNYKEKLHYLTLHQEEQKTHELITNVAHDLKTPLTSMMGYLQLLHDHPDLEDEKKEKYIKIVYEKCVRLHRLINDLFHYSAFSSKQVQYHPTKLNISELIRQITDEYYSELEAKGLLLDTTIVKPNLYVHGDGELLARVFDNLLSNAIKYNNQGKRIKLDIEEDNHTITIVISNQAKPMSSEELEHIFEKFYRTDLSRSSNTGGTGLGLAISRSIIEMHGGEIFATHQQGWLNVIVVLKKFS